jgi:hypothetical protein
MKLTFGKLTFGKYWMEFEGEPGSGACEITSNLTNHAYGATGINEEVKAVVEGVEATMLALYSHGILQHANLTQVQLALGDVVDALDNNF